MPKGYCPIVFSTKWDWDDVLACMDYEKKKKFDELPTRLQNKIMREFTDHIGKVFSYGIMHEWSDYMNVSIQETGLVDHLDKVYDEWKDGF